MSHVRDILHSDSGICLRAGGCLLTVALLCLIGCGGSGEPARVVEELLRAAQAQDLERLRSCLTPDSREALKEIMEATADERAGGGWFDPVRRPESFRVTNVEVDDDEAVVEVEVARRDGETVQETFHVTQAEGEWKVNLLYGWSDARLETLLATMRERASRSSTEEAGDQ